METQCPVCPDTDEKADGAMQDPWLARLSNRLPFSVFFVFVALLLIKPLIISRLVARAEAYASFGLYNNAERECKKALLLDNGNDLAWNTLGDSYKSQGDLDNAVNTYLNAINVNPSNKIAHFRVAMVFALQHSFNRAIPHFEYTRTLGPETGDQLEADCFSYYRASLEMLALCYQRTGRPDKMQNVIDVLEKNYPDYNRAIDKSNVVEQHYEALDDH